MRRTTSPASCEARRRAGSEATRPDYDLTDAERLGAVHTRRPRYPIPFPVVVILPQGLLAWFRNLVDGLGPALCIRIVSRNGQPAAGVLTLTHGTTVVYNTQRPGQQRLDRLQGSMGRTTFHADLLALAGTRAAGTILRSAGVVARRVFDRLPTPLRQATASVIYRHLA